MIRPMMFVDEMDVIGFKNKYDLPVVKSKCPVDGYTKRQYAKELVRQLNTEHPGAKERMFRRDPERRYKRMAGADFTDEINGSAFRKSSDKFLF